GAHREHGRSRARSVNCNFHREGARAAKSGFLKKNLRVLCAFAVDFACAGPAPMARVEIKCPQGQLAVDGAPAGEVHGKTRFSLRPGHHVFELRKTDGSVQVREADLGPGDQVALELGGTK